MKIFVLANIDSHAYLELLYTYLSKRGIIITDIKDKKDIIKIRKIADLLSADILHLHWIEYYLRGKTVLTTVIKFLTFMFILLILRLIRKKIVITPHNVVPHERLYPKIEHFGFNISLRLANIVIVHNEYSKKMTQKLYGIKEKKIRVIPHGNFISYYPNHISREKAREVLSIPRDSFVILFFGHIRPYKGLDEVIHVLSEILTERKDFYVIIAGKCEDRILKESLLKFQQKFSQKVLLKLGYIPNNEVQIYMNSADVGILPYREISTSGSLLLYMSFAKPVIVPNLEPVREVLGDSGFYFEPGDIDSLKTAIINSASLINSNMSYEVYNKALKFDWDMIARKTEKVYKEVL